MQVGGGERACCEISTYGDISLSALPSVYPTEN
jgi:hypothetical protein